MRRETWMVVGLCSLAVALIGYSFLNPLLLFDWVKP
jgi:hypothetical protein